MTGAKFDFGFFELGAMEDFDFDDEGFVEPGKEHGSFVLRKSADGHVSSFVEGFLDVSFSTFD